MKRRDLVQWLGATALSGPLAASAAWGRDVAVPVPDVRLLDQEARPHALRALCDGPTVIGFFYTGCATVCPPQTAALRALRERLDQGADRIAARRTRILSITVDPLGDPPELLRAYARRFDVRLGLDAGWLMLTGQPQVLKRVWTAFGVPVGDPSEHSSLLWLGSRAGGRWTRAAATTPTARLLEWLRRV